MIELSNVTKIYTIDRSAPIEAVKGINLRIADGEIFGIIGLSGAGKSSLIRCINMLERPTQGSVIINGQEMTSLNNQQLREARRKIGMIFQHFNLLSSRTVFDNVAFPLEIAGANKSTINERVNSLLQLVGLTDKADSYPSQLSGGQKQRVGIARALANRPDILLCDEATSALDPKTTRAILTLLKDINQTFGLSIVLITHEMAVIRDICHRVAVLEQGEIIEQGSVQQVFTNPQAAITRELVYDMQVSKQEVI